MKPIYVGLIAIASALIGGAIGAGLGGFAGGVAGGAGGAAMGFDYGICTAMDLAQAQKLLTPTQANQLSDQAYAQANQILTAKGISFTSSRDCQSIRKQVEALVK